MVLVARSYCTRTKIGRAEDGHWPGCRNISGHLWTVMHNFNDGFLASSGVHAVNVKFDFEGFLLLIGSG